MDKTYRIGLDIGIGSVGWSVMENDPITEEPTRIIKMGVRTFSPNEIAKTGESTAKDRREKRGIRRRKRRKQYRFERVKDCLKEMFGENVLSDVEKLKNQDVYALRAKALDEEITNTELSKVVLHILKRRGFKSNRKNLKGSSEEGELLKSIKENQKFMQEKGYRTIGEALFKDERFKMKIGDTGQVVYNVRNHGGGYQNCFLRADLKNELTIILDKQQQLGNTNITEQQKEKIVEIFERQRNFDEGPGKQSPYKAKFEVGNCTFIKEEKRAPKASYTFELFSALSKVNNLKIDGEELTKEQKEKLYDLVKNKEKTTFAQIRKELSVAEDKYFNLCSYKLPKKKTEGKELTREDYYAECEKADFVKLSNSYSIKKALGVESSYDNWELIDEVALLMSMCKSDSTIDKYIKGNEILKTLTAEQVENIKGLNFSKFGALSTKAMKMIIPNLFNGERYDVACKSAGFNHSSFECEKLKYLKGEEIEERLKDVTNNVVKRSVNQTLRVINEIIKEYGSPQYITIELAGELSKTRDERNKIEKSQKENLARNEDIVEELKKFGVIKPTGQDIVKYKLYLEQDGKCMYSGKSMEGLLFEPNALQIDHVLPFSKSLNDSYANKVLVIASENQNKGDRTPFEFFGHDKQKWEAYVARVNTLIKNINKRRNLLKERITEDEKADFISRNINDTRYISKLLLEIFTKYLQMKPSKHKKVVRSVNGAATNYLRKLWGINKIREDGDVHHAIDATVIATVTDGEIQKITAFNKFKEKFVIKDDKYISRETGEIMTKEEKEEYENQNLNEFKGLLPPPYENFVEELRVRSCVKYDSFEFSPEEKLSLAKMGYDDDEIKNAKPIFVSRMKTVKHTGPIHQETLMSTREYHKTKRLIKTVSISKLKICDIIEPIALKGDKYPEKSIENYYRPEDDRLLYLKLKEHLIEKGAIPEGIEFYKPRKDGTNGPLVKTVKVYEKATNCVITPNGAAANDTMQRVDVFEKDGKFYLCPIYMADVYAKKLPNKVIVRDKDWIDIDDTYNFKFSLYKNDLIKITNNKPLKFTRNFKNEKSLKPKEIEGKEIFAYYNSTGISVASVRILSHDNCYKIDSCGVKTLTNIEKYYVDIMGKIYKAPKEERKGF